MRHSLRLARIDTSIKFPIKDELILQLDTEGKNLIPIPKPTIYVDELIPDNIVDKSLSVWDFINMFAKPLGLTTSNLTNQQNLNPNFPLKTTNAISWMDFVDLLYYDKSLTLSLTDLFLCHIKLILKDTKFLNLIRKKLIKLNSNIKLLYNINTDEDDKENIKTDTIENPIENKKLYEIFSDYIEYLNANDDKKSSSSINTSSSSSSSLSSTTSASLLNSLSLLPFNENFNYNDLQSQFSLMDDLISNFLDTTNKNLSPNLPSYLLFSTPSSFSVLNSTLISSSTSSSPPHSLTFNSLLLILFPNLTPIRSLLKSYKYIVKIMNNLILLLNHYEKSIHEFESELIKLNSNVSNNIEAIDKEEDELNFNEINIKNFYLLVESIQSKIKNFFLTEKDEEERKKLLTNLNNYFLLSLLYIRKNKQFLFSFSSNSLLILDKMRDSLLKVSTYPSLDSNKNIILQSESELYDSLKQKESESKMSDETFEKLTFKYLNFSTKKDKKSESKLSENLTQKVEDKKEGEMEVGEKEGEKEEEKEILIDYIPSVNSIFNLDLLFNITGDAIKDLFDSLEAIKSLRTKELNKLTVSEKIILLSLLQKAAFSVNDNSSNSSTFLPCEPSNNSWISSTTLRDILEQHGEVHTEEILTHSKALKELRASQKEIFNSKKDEAIERFKILQNIAKVKQDYETAFNNTDASATAVTSTSAVGKKKTGSDPTGPNTEQLNNMIEELILLEQYNIDIIVDDIEMYDISEDESMDLEEEEDDEEEDEEEEEEEVVEEKEDGSRRSRRKLNDSSSLPVKKVSKQEAKRLLKEEKLKKREEREKKVAYNELYQEYTKKLNYLVNKKSEKELKNFLRSLTSSSNPLSTLGLKGVINDNNYYTYHLKNQNFYLDSHNKLLYPKLFSLSTSNSKSKGSSPILNLTNVIPLNNGNPISNRVYISASLKKVYKTLWEIEIQKKEEALNLKRELTLHESFLRTSSLGTDRYDSNRIHNAFKDDFQQSEPLPSVSSLHSNIEVYNGNINYENHSYYQFLGDPNLLFVKITNRNNIVNSVLSNPNSFSSIFLTTEENYMTLSHLYSTLKDSSSSRWGIYPTQRSIALLWEALDDRGEREKQLKLILEQRYEVSLFDEEEDEEKSEEKLKEKSEEKSDENSEEKSEEKSEESSENQSKKSNTKNNSPLPTFSFLHHRVIRNFGKKVIYGIVTGTKNLIEKSNENQDNNAESNDVYYHIIHDDGDEEDLDYHELLSSIIPYYYSANPSSVYYSFPYEKYLDFSTNLFVNYLKNLYFNLLNNNTNNFSLILNTSSASASTSTSPTTTSKNSLSSTTFLNKVLLKQNGLCRFHNMTNNSYYGHHQYSSYLNKVNNNLINYEGVLFEINKYFLLINENWKKFQNLLLKNKKKDEESNIEELRKKFNIISIKDLIEVTFPSLLINKTTLFFKEEIGSKEDEINSYNSIVPFSSPILDKIDEIISNENDLDISSTNLLNYIDNIYKSVLNEPYIIPSKEDKKIVELVLNNILKHYIHNYFSQYFSTFSSSDSKSFNIILYLKKILLIFEASLYSIEKIFNDQHIENVNLNSSDVQGKDSDESKENLENEDENEEIEEEDVIFNEEESLSLDLLKLKKNSWYFLEDLVSIELKEDEIDKNQNEETEEEKIENELIKYKEILHKFVRIFLSKTKFTDGVVTAVKFVKSHQLVLFLILLPNKKLKLLTLEKMLTCLKNYDEKIEDRSRSREEREDDSDEDSEEESEDEDEDENDEDNTDDEDDEEDEEEDEHEIFKEEYFLSMNIYESSYKNKDFYTNKLWRNFTVRNIWRKSVSQSNLISEISQGLAFLEARSYHIGLFASPSSDFITLYEEPHYQIISKYNKKKKNGSNYKNSISNIPTTSQKVGTKSNMDDTNQRSSRAAKTKAISEINKQSKLSDNFEEYYDNSSKKRKLDNSQSKSNEPSFYNSGRASRSTSRNVNYAI